MKPILKITAFASFIIWSSCENPGESVAGLELSKVKVAKDECLNEPCLGSVYEGSKLISAKLTRVKADVMGNKLSFICSLELKNNCNRDFGVVSSFYSAFDYFELVVTDSMNNLLIQIPYTYYQSSYSFEGTEFIIKKGVTAKELDFLVCLNSEINLPNDVMVRLVGTFPDSGYFRILSTNTLPLKIKPNKVKHPMLMNQVKMQNKSQQTNR